MKDINKVELLGTVVQACKLTYPNDSALCTFELETKELYTDRDKLKRVHKERHSIESWGSVAERLADFANVNARILISGKVKTKTYVDKSSNEKVSRKVILVKEFHPVVFTESEYEYEDYED